MCLSLTLGAIFKNQATLAAIFPEFSGIARICDKSKLLGVPLRPRLLHHWCPPSEYF